VGGLRAVGAGLRVAAARAPASAIAYMRAQRSASGKGLDALPAEILAVLPFVVSRGHLAIRKRLGIGVHS
jgi:hypothetical protein